mmetsp:Transcript_23394/g.72468  ORF Transcript_23394/g.72468 Transcript_23394/m.72468 type:complete len:451 (-) Transcript_23394:1472-2824(-)
MHGAVHFAALDAHTNFVERAGGLDFHRWLVHCGERRPRDVGTSVLGGFALRLLFLHDAVLDQVQVLARRIRRVPREDQGRVALLLESWAAGWHRRRVEDEVGPFAPFRTIVQGTHLHVVVRVDQQVVSDTERLHVLGMLVVHFALHDTNFVVVVVKRVLRSSPVRRRCCHRGLVLSRCCLGSLLARTLLLELAVLLQPTKHQLVAHHVRLPHQHVRIVSVLRRLLTSAPREFSTGLTHVAHDDAELVRRQERDWHRPKTPFVVTIARVHADHVRCVGRQLANRESRCVILDHSIFRSERFFERSPLAGHTDAIHGRFHPNAMVLVSSWSVVILDIVSRPPDSDVVFTDAQDLQLDQRKRGHDLLFTPKAPLSSFAIVVARTNDGDVRVRGVEIGHSVVCGVATELFVEHCGRWRIVEGEQHEMVRLDRGISEVHLAVRVVLVFGLGVTRP